MRPCLYLSYTGKLFLADISVPAALYAELKLNLADKPLFAEDEIIRLR